jgi:hypothetical protein
LDPRAAAAGADACADAGGVLVDIALTPQSSSIEPVELATPATWAGSYDMLVTHPVRQSNAGQAPRDDLRI